MPEHLTTVTFTEEDGKTRVTTRVQFSSAEALKVAVDIGMPQGMTITWAYLTEYVQELGDSLFYFVTDGIGSAVAKAQELAGEKNVALHGASSVQQALKAGLLDEFHMSIAYVLLGEGVRLFDHLGASPIHLEHIRTLETPGATHLSFRVVK